MHFLLENMQELLAGDTKEKAETRIKMPGQLGGVRWASKTAMATVATIAPR
jgi:hypothetical protein